MHDHHLISKVLPKCPACNKEQDGALGGTHAPINGDYSICIYCASINVFSIEKNNYVLREANTEDLEIAKQQGLYNKLIALQMRIKIIINE